MKKIIAFLLAFIIGSICVAIAITGIIYNLDNVYFSVNNDRTTFFPTIQVKELTDERQDLVYNLDEIDYLDIVSDEKIYNLVTVVNSPEETIEISFLGDYQYEDGKLTLSPLKGAILDQIQITIKTEHLDYNYNNYYNLETSSINDFIDRAKGGINE